MNSRLLTAAAVFLTLASGALDLPGLPDPQSGRSGRPFNILQTNEEDGTASNIQAFYNTLTDAGCSSIVSATNRGVVGVENFVETWEPEPDPVSPHKCVGDSCPPLPSPTSNARDELHHDPSTTKRIHYIDAPPAAAMEYCVNVLAPKLFGGSKPDIVVSGPNEGEDVDKGILLSSTIHAVRAATGDMFLPAIAFSGRSRKSHPFTPLRSQIYADIATNVTITILNSGAPYLPDDTFLIVNLPDVDHDSCNNQFKFVLTRLHNSYGWTSEDQYSDAHIRMHQETRPEVRENRDCYVFISAGKGSDGDATESWQLENVAERLKSILSSDGGDVMYAFGD